MRGKGKKAKISIQKRQPLSLNKNLQNVALCNARERSDWNEGIRISVGGQKIKHNVSKEENLDH